MKFFRLQLVCLFLIQTVYAAGNNNKATGQECLVQLLTVMGHTVPVTFGEGKSQQTFPRLVKTDLPGLHTVIIHSKNGIVPDDSKGIVMSLPGSGGKVGSEFGIVRSLSPLVNLLEKYFKVGAVGLQLPIYFQSEGKREVRAPYLEKYGNIQGNIEWISNMAAFIRSQDVHKGTEKQRPLFLTGRSTGAALLLQTYHEFAMGNPKFQWLADVDAIFAMAVDGHTPEYIEKWHKTESEYLWKYASAADFPVMYKGPKIFEAMTWQTQTANEAPKGKIPRLFMTIGVQDEFNPTSVLEGPIKDFVRAHPFADITLIMHDGFHDMGRAIPGVTQSLERFKVALTQFMTEKPTGQKLNIVYYPDEATVLRTVGKNPLENKELPADYFSRTQMMRRLTGF